VIADLSAMQQDAVRIQSPYVIFTLQHEENTAHSADSHPPLYLAALTAFAFPPLAAPAAAPGPAPAPAALFFAAAALFAPVAAPFLPLLLATCDKNPARVRQGTCGLHRTETKVWPQRCSSYSTQHYSSVDTTHTLSAAAVPSPQPQTHTTQYET
jgi:hypothetical protein